jgi:hypothetical protein
MKELVIHLVLLVPVYGETLFDYLMWRAGKDDKPVSTFVVRPVLMVTSTIFVFIVSKKEWWIIVLLILSYHLLFFPLLINVVNNKKLSYLSDTQCYDRLMGRIPFIPRIFFQFIVVATLLCLFYRDLIL